tara:strand:- start:167 stop:433 length:267 start_codon:yes stop_codon:yes gene_type:complete
MALEMEQAQSVQMEKRLMPWNPEHYIVNTKEKKKAKLLPLKDHWIPGLTERPRPPEDPNDNWWERHESYIEHRKTYPYGQQPEIKDET